MAVIVAIFVEQFRAMMKKMKVEGLCMSRLLPLFFVFALLQSCTSVLAADTAVKTGVSVSNSKSNRYFELGPEEKPKCTKGTPWDFDIEKHVVFMVGDGEQIDTEKLPFMKQGELALLGNKLQEAEAIFRHATLKETDKVIRSRAMLKLGMVHMLMNKDAEAELNEAACGLVCSQRNVELGNAFFHLGKAVYEKGHYLWAAEQFRRSVDVLSPLPYEQDLAGRGQNSLANCLYMLNRFSAAEKMYREAAANLGDTSCDTVVHNIVLCCDALGKPEAAQKALLENLERSRSGWGVGDALEMVCNYLERRKEFAAAIGHCERVLPQVKAVPGDHNGYYRILERLGTLCFKNGDDGKSLQYYREAESDWKKDGNTSNAVYVSGCIASVYYAQGDYKKALPLFENWYQYQCRENGVSSPKTIVARNKLAMCYMKVGQISKAEEMLRASITIGKEAGWSAYCNRCLGNFYRAQKEWIKASTAYNTASQWYRTAYGDTCPQVASMKSFIELSTKRDTTIARDE